MVNARHFLGTARKLLESAPTEADQRSSVSRTYYAVHGIIWAALKQKVPWPLLKKRFDRGHVTHRPLRECLSESPDEEIKEIAKEFDQLWDLRVLADYKLEKPWGAARAGRELQNSIDLLLDIRSVGEDKIAKHVSEYLGKIPDGRQ